MAKSVRERFPDREAEIRVLYLHDAEFRSVCHDFGVCVDEIAKLTESNDSSSKSTNQRLEQYRDLESELEAEITEALNAVTKSGRVPQEREE